MTSDRICGRGRAQNIVVLAGWLGCKRKSLRRYETMYRDMGWDVIIRIASPVLVVKAASGIDDTHGATPKAQEPPRSMRHLALQTLQEVQDSQCNIFIFHVFSNGGAFLWEAVCDIIQQKNSNVGEKDYSILRNTLAGVVFDSSPAYYEDDNRDRLKEALSYATEREKKEANFILEKARIERGDTAFERSRKQRAQKFWQNMRNDEFNVPHLYLYSKADCLAPYEAISELVNDRTSLFGRDNVTSLSFADSSHCSHLVTYPEQYRLEVGGFLAKCLANNISNINRSTLASRL